MKIKSLFVVLTFVASMVVANAQNFKNGDQVINAGIGLGSTLGGGLPISVSYEKGFKDGVLDKGVLSWGALVGYASYKTNFVIYDWTYTYIVIGGRCALHYPIVDNSKLDTYAGLMLGYNIVTISSSNSLYKPGSSSGLNLGGFIGARYSFTDKLAGMLELGYDVAYLKLGVAYKL